MTSFTLMTVAILVFVFTGSLKPGLRLLAAAGAVVALTNPPVGAGLAMIWFSLRRRRSLRSERLAQAQAERELEVLTHSMKIGLSGGLSPASALALSRQGLITSLGHEVDLVLRQAVEGGLTASLLNTTGVGGRLFRQIGAAHLSGSPLDLVLTAQAAEYRHATRSAAVERARRLPVKMVLPLTLLMLPGLLILMVSPLVLPSVARIFGPYLST
ncbi:MAG: hypothetical protein F4Y75_02830 [Acidimicrobiia bacterium]|nr:type II secretion system F family protein [bacterium]MXX65277.1 hypothetical protein [Acidimicrobiia bacterium]MCY3579393.1 type II secretion system F family protein [bacterium]MCY3652344.1 type II secretion system F family protein [bacterium]MXZ06441.1 hypothetical protein [Acidimicrobiia bacterium]